MRALLLIVALILPLVVRAEEPPLPLTFEVGEVYSVVGAGVYFGTSEENMKLLMEALQAKDKEGLELLAKDRKVGLLSKDKGYKVRILKVDARLLGSSTVKGTILRDDEAMTGYFPSVLLTSKNFSLVK